ncbi:beta/gamma crystallin domain-containing protein 1 isoform X2 [Sphaerodactylus townsendi]|uniref:beta/gamma crystallin domain-containing protein 1 isoform X2 n=1 Tax=Sphaerodactylus townsendi TaxID=933632 RepID=UPI002026A096|nr:beta/gamma crystallin domain-containing protein 1 isoform X2 [Sphaerodactylus townsendi]
MEKGGFKKLGRLFHRSESEDSEPDTSRGETPLPSPCPSPSLQGNRQHRHSDPSTGGSSSSQRKKRSGFGHWGLKKKHKERQAAAVEASSGSQLSAPSSPSLSLSSHFTASEPTTPTDRYFDMPDAQFGVMTNQPSPVPSQESQFPFAISIDTISASTLPSSFRKSKTQSPESSKEAKKKPVLGKFGNFFTTGRKKNTKNITEASLRTSVKSARSGSPQPNTAPLASIDDFKEISKSEECILEKIYSRNQPAIQNSVEDTEEYIYTKDLTPLYNDIVSEWNCKGASSDSEWSPDWHSSNETIKNTLFGSNLTLQTSESEKYLNTDPTKATTPNFFRSLTNISNEDQDHSILNHKQLLSLDQFAELKGTATKDQSSVLEAKPSERAHSSRVLTLDIFLRRTEQSISNEFSTALLEDNYSSADEMDKKSAVRRSGKRRKSQSSGDAPNGDRNAAETSTKEESVFDGISSDLVVDQINNSERKVKTPQQITTNHDMKTASNYKGCTKAEMEKNKQQTPAASPYRRKSLKKNQSDSVPLSPTDLKAQGKDSSTKRQVQGATNGSLMSKSSSIEKLSSGENTVESFRVASLGVQGNSTSPVTEGRMDSANNCDGSVLLHADKNRNSGVRTTNGKQTGSDLDSTKLRNACWDASRTVTTKINLPAKPKNVELNLKAPKNSEDVGSEQDSMDRAAKINFSIANKISMFESKQSNHNPTAEVSTSKKGSVSNTFVGRAKLKFGKQPAEGEQTTRVTSKENNHQKPLQNGAKLKAGSSETKLKNEEGGIINSKEVRNTVGSLLNQNDKGNNDDDQVSVFVSKKHDTELAKDNLLPKTTSLQQIKETETAQNIINSKMNATSVSPERGQRPSVDRNTCSPCKNDTNLQQSNLVLKKLEFENVNSEIDSDNKKANTILESKQVFEQNRSEQESPSRACNVSKTGNDESICDSPSDMEKFTETLKNLDSSICIPQKKKKTKLPKSPAPHFAMPPIHEDNLEKVFDPNVFTVGLGIKRDRPLDLAPCIQLKLQSLETDAKVRPKRASAENSLLLQALTSSNRRDPAVILETSGKENLDSADGDIKRSRLENSAIFSSLLSSKDKVFMPSVTSVNTITTSFASQKSTDSTGKTPLRFDTAQLLEAFSGKTQVKINPRPGKIVIYNKSDPSENAVEVFHDMPDCTSWVLSPVIFVKVVRGCWILYEKPNFEGPSIPLEEGELELTNIWGEQPSDDKDECKSSEPAVIGSIRHVVKDYRLCRIDLFTEPGGLGMVKSYFDDAEETRIIGATEKTRSIQVYWGIWLLYEESGFQGIPLMLEPGEYPDLSFWGKKEAYIRSMRPLKMGGRKVEHPENPKVIVYEKPFFEGNHIELDTELAALPKEENQEGSQMKKLPLTSVGSMKVTGGIWIAYEKPGFTGHQYLLEEGEYWEWKDWGGYDEQVQSLRPALGRLPQPHMIMYTEKDFGIKGSSINVLGIISNLKDTGYGLRTQSIHVLSGVWVAYENPDFTGEQYILDKGMYPNYETWGGRNCKISSVQPIVLDTTSDYMGKFKVQLFSEPEFQGRSQVFEKNASQIDDLFPAKSSKVLSGSWIAYDKENFSGNQYVLEEGAYPDLPAMGCLPHTCLKSLQVINIEFSEPAIALFEKENFRGKKMEFTTEIVNLKFLGYNPHVASVQVLGGTWLVYEHSNYKGRQILLKPENIPNWLSLSGYHKIGSLRPLLQKRVYFKLRNKETGQFVSTDGNVDDLNLLRMQVADDNDKSDEQAWIYQGGYLKCRMAEDFCLTIVGSLITPGAKLGLALQQNEEKQQWNINPDGRIYSKIKPNLVLDIKGGTQYDRNHLIVSSISEDKATQRWEPLVV